MKKLVGKGWRWARRPSQRSVSRDANLPRHNRSQEQFPLSFSPHFAYHVGEIGFRRYPYLFDS
jgi:hypothetical protein